MSKINVSEDAAERWDRYKDTAKRDVIFAQASYKGADTEEFENLARQVPEGFSLIFCSDYLDDTKEHEFRAAVFINNTTKEVIAASSGTRFGATIEGFHDMYNDVFLAFESTPPKLQSVKKLNELILENLKDEVGDYKIHYTGHSLGAAISDMAAADMAIKCRASGKTPKDISSMTFENPGARAIIEKMYEEAGLDSKDYSKDVSYVGINNKRNVINQGTKHAGKMFELIPDDKNPNPDLWAVLLEFLSEKIEPYFPLVSRVLKTMSFGGLAEQMDSHKLDHFEDVLVKESKGGVVRNAKEVTGMPLGEVLERAWDNAKTLVQEPQTFVSKIAAAADSKSSGISR